MTAKDRAFFCMATLVYIKIDGGSFKLKTAAFVFSGDVVCFQWRRVRHNVNYVGYVQMPGGPLCSIPFKRLPLVCSVAASSKPHGSHRR